MLYSVCERCGNANSGCGPRPGVVVGREAVAPCGARFWCPRCQAYWHRLYAGQGRFAWLRENRGEPPTMLH